MQLYHQESKLILDFANIQPDPLPDHEKEKIWNHLLTRICQTKSNFFYPFCPSTNRKPWAWLSWVIHKVMMTTVTCEVQRVCDRTGVAFSCSGIFMTSGGLGVCGCDVSCYHGDSRHMFPTSTGGASDADKCGHTHTHTQACTHTQIHPEGKQDRKPSGGITVNSLFSLTGILTWRFLSEDSSTSSSIHQYAVNLFTPVFPSAFVFTVYYCFAHVYLHSYQRYISECFVSVREQSEIQSQ